MFDTSKTRRLKWKARLNERRHRVAAAWNHALAGERNLLLRTERNLKRWRRTRNNRQRMEAAQRATQRARRRTEAAKRRAKRTVAKNAAKVAAKTATAAAAVKTATKGKRGTRRRPARTARARAA